MKLQSGYSSIFPRLLPIPPYKQNFIMEIAYIPQYDNSLPVVKTVSSKLIHPVNGTFYTWRLSIRPAQRKTRR